MDEDVRKEVNRFLRMRGLEPEDIDLVITGDNGEEREDNIYREIRASLFPGKPSSGLQRSLR